MIYHYLKIAYLHNGLKFLPRVGTRPDQMDRPVGDRVLVGRWSGFGRFYLRILWNFAFLKVPGENLASLSVIFTPFLPLNTP